MSRPSTSASNPEKIKVLVCTANLGNKQPDCDSLDAWIPKDGCVNNVLENSLYPIQTNAPEGNMLQSAITSTAQRLASIAQNTANSMLCVGPVAADDFALSTKKNVPDNPISDQIFDIIVIGMQEATFDVEDIEDDEEGKNTPHTGKSNSIVMAAKAVSNLTTAKDHMKKIQKKKHFEPHSSIAKPDSNARSIAKPDSYTRSRNGSFSAHESLKGLSDTDVLHFLFQDQLTGYTQAVSYQRGEMRLMLFYNEGSLTLDVLSVKAQNTGRAGLANKGGIVAEVNVNSGTRLAFLTAHLEAHEGPAKYETRCSTIGDIFQGTTSSVTELHCDASLASHFMIAMGDLNFRTKLPGYEAGSPQHVMAAHKLVENKDWVTLNTHDELSQALRRKDCFAGFSTPPCYFPPTFKVQRQAGYEYNEIRSPSYTDRILYRATHRLSKNIKPMVYEPVDDFTSSDHKPIRGAFEIELNPKLKWRPTLAKR
jgi:hypothetical protein